MLKLNLGAGDQKIKGYTSIDLYDETADVQADICELPYEDDSVDGIIAYQVIEHLPYNKSDQAIFEMWRVLKPNCKAIVETPDVDYVCKKILDEGLKDKWIYNLVGEYYRPWDKDRYVDWEMNANAIHRNPWNWHRLRSMAFGVGFREVKKNRKKYADYPENLSVTLFK